MSLFRRQRRTMPGLNTASMPDLVFTVLFFFMIVTHLHEVPERVKYDVPEAEMLDKLRSKSSVVYLYVGTAKQPDGSMGTAFQVNDRMVRLDDIAEAVTDERKAMNSEDRQQMVVCIKADLHTRMETVNAVKEQLRKAGALKIQYSADVKRK
ncbi:MAG: ExbD/TolR family protein [Prevotella sp.]